MPRGVYERTEYHNEINRRGHIGKKMSDECKEKQRLRMLGNKIMVGRKHSKETLLKKSIAMKGEKNHLWKGEDCSYRSLHRWVEQWKGKAKKCSVCEKSGEGRSIQWANIDHKYKRNLDDYIEMCTKCHSNFDKINNKRRFGKTRIESVECV